MCTVMCFSVQAHRCGPDLAQFHQESCIKHLLDARHWPELLGTLSEDNPFWPGRAILSAKGLRSHLGPVGVFMRLETLSYILFSEFLTYLFCGLWSTETWLSLCFLKPFRPLHCLGNLVVPCWESPV